MSHTLLCYGDSNTYGYDPRDIFGGRYGAESRWCDLLAKKTGWTVINYGENGRALPRYGFQLQMLFQELAPADTLLIMLGTNDLLTYQKPDVHTLAQQLGLLLEVLREQFPALRVILLSPPPISVPEAPALAQLAQELGAEYRRLAQQWGVGFVDTHSWGLTLGADGVHLTAEAHRRMADRLAEILPELLEKPES